METAWLGACLVLLMVDITPFGMYSWRGKGVGEGKQGGKGRAEQGQIPVRPMILQNLCPAAVKLGWANPHRSPQDDAADGNREMMTNGLGRGRAF